MKRPDLSARNTKHGEAMKGMVTAEYRVWRHIIQRCYFTATKQYADYGGRGISVCQEWRHDYPAFLKAMGRRPSKLHCIDRIDVNGNYEPSNCRWVTRTVSNRNRRNAVFITIDGVTKSAPEWNDICGFKPNTVVIRYWNGWRGKKLLLPQANGRIVWDEEHRPTPKKHTEATKRLCSERKKAWWAAKKLSKP